MISQIISHYRIIGKLGAGGMGEVYLAEDTRLRRNVAIKILPPELLTDKQAKKRLILEAQAAAKLDHPNICTIHEVVEEADYTCIVMQYIKGETLYNRIRGKHIDIQEIITITTQIADAMAEAHSHGVIHRDIKPQNVLITMRSQVKILDFGLAKLVQQNASDETESVLTAPDRILGTVPYMSPEQIRGESLDGRSDIFSLGTMLYEMITGRHPFKSDTAAATIAAILTRDPPPLSQFRQSVPIELQRIVSKSICKDREDRYQSVEGLLAELQKFRQQANYLNSDENLYANLADTIPITGSPTEKSETIPIGAAEPESIDDKKQSSFFKPALAALAIIVGLVIAALILWGNPWKGTAPGVSQRLLNYSVVVLRDGETFQEPSNTAKALLFEKSDQIKLRITSPQSGYLYVLNQAPYSDTETPSYVLLFPARDSAFLDSNQEIRIPKQGWMLFDQYKNIEKIWLIWSSQSVDEMEALKKLANPLDQGLISDPDQLKAVQEFLSKYAASKRHEEKDEVKELIKVEGEGDILVYLLKLEPH